MELENAPQIHGVATPDYLLTVAGQDITPMLGGRLISLTLREDRGEEADTLDITLNDSDGRMAIPNKGAEISLSIGWRGQALVDKGTFIVDEVEHSGAPDQISIRARSAAMGRTIRQRHSRSWHGVTLQQVAREVADDNDLELRIAPELARKPIAHIDQTNESDMHFLTRLARQWDATCAIKKGGITILPISSSKTASGAPLPLAHITRSSGDSHRYHSADRTAYTGVQAEWTDPRSAKRHTVTAGEDAEGETKMLKDLYASRREAQQAAEAELARVQRGEATFSLTLATGQPTLAPQTRMTVSGFKPQIDDTQWLVKSVEHNIGDGGYTTTVEMERGVDADSDDQED